MDVSAPTADSEPMRPTSPSPPPPAPPDRIVGGVAALIAWRLGLDALWVRIGFVLLALAGGVGLVVYGGLWLLLVAGPQWRSRGVRVAGGVVLVAGVPLVLDAGDFEILTGPVAVVLLLAGLALALWQPRTQRSPAAAAAPLDLATPERAPLASPSWTNAAPGGTRDAASVAEPVPAQPGPAPSPLGRAVIGLAIAVAAAGALIDQANGGRLHPEQWLGAGTVVCGIGLLVAAFVGRGRWLIVPALLFAAVGYTAGHLARLGVPLGDTFDDRSIYIGEGVPGGSTTLETGFGVLEVHVDGTPVETHTVDARAAFGTIRIFTVDDVAVLVEPHVDDDGEVLVDGLDVDGPVRLGPDDRSPAVVIDARVGPGTVEINTFDRSPRFVEEPAPPLDPPTFDLGTVTRIAEAVDVTDDGWFVLAGGAAVIDGDDVVVVGETITEPRGVTVIVTPIGEFRLLPRGLLIAPWSEVLDLQAIRSSIGAGSEPSGPSTTTETSTTATTTATTTTSIGGPP